MRATAKPSLAERLAVAEPWVDAKDRHLHTLLLSIQAPPVGNSYAASDSGFISIL